MRMDVKDRGVLAALGFDDHGEGSWRVLRRGGLILLLVPDCASLVSKGLQLYRPQRLPARLFVGAVSRVPFGRLLLKRIKGSISNGAAIQTVLETTEATLVCILLGNPSQKERRIILLAETGTGHRFIIKLGWGVLAVEKISRERKFLEMNAGRKAGHKTIAINICGRWKVFVTMRAGVTVILRDSTVMGHRLGHCF